MTLGRCVEAVFDGGGVMLSFQSCVTGHYFKRRPKQLSDSARAVVHVVIFPVSDAYCRGELKMIMTIFLKFLLLALVGSQFSILLLPTFSATHECMASVTKCVPIMHVSYQGCSCSICRQIYTGLGRQQTPLLVSV